MSIIQDFFKERWMMAVKVSGSKPEDGCEVPEAVDLTSIVPVTGNLVSLAAKHKLAVKPQGRRATAAFQSRLLASQVSRHRLKMPSAVRF